MLTIYFKSQLEHDLAVVNEARNGSWLNVDNATEVDLQEVARLTGLQPIDLDDILDPHELPRLERVGNNTIIFVRTPQENSSLKGGEKYLYTDPLAIIINDEYFITLAMSQNISLSRLIENQSDIITTQSGKLLVYILLAISDEFVSEIRNVRKDVLAKQRRLKKVTDQTILDLVEDEEVLNQYLSALVPMNNVLEQMISGRRQFLFADDKELLEDMINSTRQSIDLCRVNIKSIQSLRDSYQIIFSNRLNNTIKTLTIFTILMTIPMVISSIFGMNVPLPYSNNVYSFVVILIAAVIGMSAFILYYRKKF
jgi:magnesium transporter